MTTVTVRFSPLPAHVRTARLVAAAVARRSGVEEAVLDEVRLAVGEACSRAVDLHRRHCPTVPVTLALTDAGTSFHVEVTDSASADDEPQASLVELAETSDAHGELLDAGLDGGVLPANVGIAVITGLVDDLRVERRGEGLALCMTWPLGAHAHLKPASPRRPRPAGGTPAPPAAAAPEAASGAAPQAGADSLEDGPRPEGSAHASR